MDLSAATDEKCTSIPNVDLLGRRDCASMVPQCFVYVCMCACVYKTDIEDNKCSWLVVQALSRATADQQALLEVSEQSISFF